MRKMVTVPRWFMVSGLAVSMVGCGDMFSTGGAKSLHDRLGGKPAITAVVDQFVENVAGDGRISGRFATTDIPKLKKNLVDQICSASGGPCTYTGRDMKTTHAGMKITTGDFNALVEDLVAALDKAKVPEQEKKNSSVCWDR